MSENPQIAFKSLTSWRNAIAAPSTGAWLLRGSFSDTASLGLCVILQPNLCLDPHLRWPLRQSEGLARARVLWDGERSVPRAGGRKLRAFLWRNNFQKFQESRNRTWFGVRGKLERLLVSAWAKQSRSHWRKSESWGPFNFSYLAVWIPPDVPSPALLGAHGGSW